MSTTDFIDARRFTFSPFPHPLHPDETGDSGALEMAVPKIGSSDRYIVKRGFPELGCNEFMYHKVATLIGLYTQPVKLIRGAKKHIRAAAIRYEPDARPFILESSSAENLRAYCMFEALYVILNESDSHEYYLDGQGKLFKLDNAASFTVEEAIILLFEGNPIGQFFIPDINAPLNAVGYEYYGLRMQAFAESIGQYAVDAYVSAIRRFASLNELALDEAYSALDKQYPSDLKNYFAAAIRIRKNTCRRFLKSLGAGS